MLDKWHFLAQTEDTDSVMKGGIPVLSVLPEEIRSRVMLLLLGALLCVVSVVLMVKNRRRLSAAAFISLMALCTVGTLGCLSVAVCVSALFTRG